MKTFIKITVALLLSIPALVCADGTQPQSRTLFFNARIEIDPTGHVLQSEIIGSTGYKPELLELIESKLSETAIEPQLYNGTPVKFSTGIRMEVVLTSDPEGLIVEIKEHFLYPITLHKVHLPKPRALSSNVSDSPIVVNCTVGIEGICTSLDVDVPLGVPRPDAVKYAKAMYKQWKFEPQSANGVPIIGKRVFTIYLNGPGVQHFEHKVRHPKFTSPRGPVVAPSTRRR